MRAFFLGGLLLAVAACSGGGEATAQRDPQTAFQNAPFPGAPPQGAPQPVYQGGPQQVAQGGPQGMPPYGPSGGPQQVAQGGPQQAPENEAQQALQGLYAIRQQQCQSGNTLACQSLGQFSGFNQELTQTAQGCRSGAQQACAAYNSLSQRIFKAYAESAQVMQQGAQASAQMDAWRSQMNANHANNMARLGAQAAAGQAAHQARQESYAAQNQAWANGQASAERSTGRFNDYVYEGTTVNGAGVQTRIPYGSTGYTDGRGNVVAVPDGGTPPDGWQRMNPTYAAPN